MPFGNMSLSRMTLGAGRSSFGVSVSIAFDADATGTLATITPPDGYSLPDADQTGITLTAGVVVDLAGALAGSPGAVTENASGDIATTYAALVIGQTAVASGPITLIRDSDGVAVTGRLVATISGVTEVAWDFKAGTSAGQITESSGFVTEWASTTAGIGTITLEPDTASQATWTSGTEGPSAYVDTGTATLTYTFTEAPEVDRFGVLPAVTLDGLGSGRLGEVVDGSGGRIISVDWDGVDQISATLEADDGTTWTVSQTHNGDPTVVIGAAVNAESDELLLTVSTASDTAATTDTASVTGYTPRVAGELRVGAVDDMRLHGLELLSPTALASASLETLVETEAATYHDTGFTPADLFANSEVGDVWNPYDSSTTWQDTSASTAAGLGDDVARIDGLAGNHNLIQATSGSRPTLGTSTRNLEWDGVDDGMYLSSISLASKVATVAITLESGLATTGATQILAELTDNFGATDGAFFANFNSSGELETIIQDGASSARFRQDFTTGLAASQPLTLFIEYDNTTVTGDVKVWFDGSEQSTTVGFNNKDQSSTFAAASTFNVGARAASGTLSFPVAFTGGPMMFINRALTAQERSDYVGWVAGL